MPDKSLALMDFRVHVRSVRDMKRTRGAMDSFEQFLRPQGKGSLTPWLG